MLAAPRRAGIAQQAEKAVMAEGMMEVQGRIERQSAQPARQCGIEPGRAAMAQFVGDGLRDALDPRLRNV